MCPWPDTDELPGLTAAENVSLPLELDGTSARKARIAALKTLDGLGPGNRAGHYPDQLSGGERQRVAIGMPLIAAAVAWLVTLREPPAIARQPLE
jgi:putative ABC transport system ATP-binding protein